VRVLCLIVVITGCSSGKQEPPPPGEPAKQAVIVPAESGMSAAEAERYAVMTEKLAATVALHKQDCAKLAAGINAVLDANRETLKLGAEARATGKQLPAAALARIQARLPDMVTDLEKCVADPAVQAAFARYRGEPAAKPEMAAADAERIVALVDQLQGAVTKTQTDCAKMAVAINRVIDANAALLKLAAEAQTAGKQLPPAIFKKLLERLGTLAPSMQKCAGDKAVMQAFGRFQL
jgi:hypothetical protein